MDKGGELKNQVKNISKEGLVKIFSKKFRNEAMQAIYIWCQNGTFVYQLVLFWNFLQNFDMDS